MSAAHAFTYIRDPHSLRSLRIDLTRFLDELRRRKVFRTAAAYLAAAFVVLQAADLTFEPLGFSADAYRLLVIVAAVGFPVAVVLSWLFDLRSERPAFSARSGGIIAGILLLIGAGAFAWFAAFRYQHADYGSNKTIAVMPFQVVGGPQLGYLGNGIVEMVSRNVDGAGHLRAISPEMVLTAARKQKSADRLARQLGARYVVSGNIAQAGSRMRITASVQDFNKADAGPITKEVTGTADSLFDVVDRLSAQILAATRSGEDAHLSESAALTTTSLPALRAYLEGEDHYRKAQFDSAIGHYANATTLDSTFALAYYRMAVAQVQNNQAAAARAPIARAVRFSDRLSKRDQGLVQSFADAFDGHWAKAESELRQMLQDYPNDLELLFNLGQIVMYRNPRHAQPAVAAKAYFERVAKADPEFLCPI